MVLDEGKISKTSNFGINEHCALIEKIEASDIFAKPLNDTQVQNLANYFVTLPSEPAMKLWTSIGKGVNENVIALHKSKSDDGTKVSTRMITMLTGKNE